MNSFKLETTFKGVNLGKHFAAAKEALKNFKDKIEELKGFNKDDQFIHEYFCKLRNQIDIEREVVKLKIDEHYLNLIDEVNDIEEKCMSKSADLNRIIENEVEKFTGNLESFRVEFDKLEIDFDKWESVRVGSNCKLKDLNEKILKFENDLLLNHIYTFESNTTLFLVANKASKIIAKNYSIGKGEFWLLIILILMKVEVLSLNFIRSCKRAY